MPEPQNIGGAGRARWRSAGRRAAIGVGVVVVLLAGVAASVESAWFRESLRKRVVAEIERVTGSRVELREFTFAPRSLEVTLRGLTVHGPEKANEGPLFSAELIEAGWKITSFWNLRADLRFLRIFKPAIHVAYREDGSSNLPLGIAPSLGNQSRIRSLPAEVMALRAGRVEILRGEMRLSMRSREMLFPLDVRAENVQLSLDREPGADRYAGRLDFRRATIEPVSRRPLTASGRAKFTLSSQKIDIESVELRTAGSQLSLQGAVGDVRSPRLDFHYNLLVDAAEAAQLLGGAAWQGQAGWRGQGTYTDKDWQLEGPLTLTVTKSGIAALPSVPWSGKAQLRLAGRAKRDAKEETEFWQAEVKDVNVELLGGRMTGRASVEVTPATTDTRMELTADRISLPALSSSLARLPAPLARLQWAGAISGPTKLSFTGAGDALTLGLDWRIDASPVVPSGFTAVSGVLRGGYRGADRHLESDGSHLKVGPTVLAADGWFDANDSRLAVRIDASRPEDARPLVELLWSPPAGLFSSLHGPVRTTLHWMGGTEAPRIHGNLRIADFDYRGLRWNSLSGAFDLSSGGRRAGSREGVSARSLEGAAAASPTEIRRAELKIDSGRLERQGETLDFQGFAELTNGELSRQSPLSLQAAFHNFNLGDLGTAAQVRIPMQARMDGTFRASGTLEDPRGSGSVTLTSLTSYGESAERLAAQIELLPGKQLVAHRILLQKGKGSIEGEASIGLQSREFRFALSGANLALESLRFVREHLPATGVVRAKLTGSGTFDRPAIQAALEIGRLSLGGWRNGHFTVDADASDGKASVKWKGNLLAGDLQGSGDVELKNSYPFTARLEFANVDLASLLQGDREVRADWKGRAAGSLTADGNLNGPQVLAARGEIDTLAVSGGPVAVRNDRPVTFRYERGAIELEKMRLVGNNSDLEAAGTISVARDPAIHLAIKGHSDLASITAASEPSGTDLALAGAVSLDAEIGGTVAKPVWRGRLDFNDASLRYANLPNGISRIKGTVRIDGNRARLENVTAESGGGALKLGGFATYSSASGVAAQLEAEISGMRIRYPEGVSTWLDGRLTLTGSTKASTLGGRLTIVKETANPEFDVGAALLSHAEEPLIRAKTAALQNLRLDVQVVSATNLSLETSTAKNLRGDVDLRIQGSLEHPALVGRINILQGEISIGGRRYLADSGELTFSNPFRIEPVLNLHVRARVEQYDVTLNFSGPLDRLTITYSSDPPLPTSEILALMVAGNAYSTTQRAGVSGGLQQLGAGSLLSQALNQQMGNRLDRIFGAGHIRVDPQIAGFDRPANANIALEQHFSDNLTLLYVTNVTSAQQRIIQGEWSLSPRFSVTAVRDQNILLGVNFQIKLRFR